MGEFSIDFDAEKCYNNSVKHYILEVTMNRKTLQKKIILSLCIGVGFTALSYYFMLPAINVYDTGFWFYLSAVILSFSIPFLFKKNGEGTNNQGFKIINMNGKAVTRKLNKVTAVLVLIPVAVVILGSVFSSQIFNARQYASIISVKEAVFKDDMKETDSVTNIALMDSASAELIGKNTMGKLADNISQYEIGVRYTQINYKNNPKKVNNLEYADFFRWLNNKEKGIPGYVMVDPVDSKANSAEYIEFEKPLKYVDSAYFGEDLMRKLRFEYPTKIFDFVTFEIDDEGNPYYIVSCLTARIGLFGAMDVNEVIIFDPSTGESQLYAVEDTPSWVDTVYSGNLAVEKYNWYGMLSGGYFNSIINKVGCKQTTDDYGYITIEDDVWYFTGVTSVTADESNIGFIISNARTGEYIYYAVAGAEEYSAMNAAQGQVQNMGYKASFPSLVNISGEATYIMVLKDDNGYVKQFALVNVENVNIVAIGESQREAIENYRALLKKNGVVTTPENPELDGEIKSTTVTVIAIRDVVIGGETYVYITADDGYVYKCSVAENEAIILVDVGDFIKIDYVETDVLEIRLIQKFYTEFDQ